MRSNKISRVCDYCDKKLIFTFMQFKGRLYHLLPKFEHIFLAVIIFFPFFCADTFITSLLLIVCALR